MESPLNLTCGIELEFFIAYPLTRLARKSPERRDVGSSNGSERSTDDEFTSFAEEICSLLSTAGFKTRSTGLREMCTSDEQGKWTLDWKQDQYGCWRVEKESSLNTSEGGLDSTHTAGPKMYQGIELISPVLDMDDPGYLETISTVMGLVKSRFEILINRSCGLHVHIGNGRLPIPEETCRKILAFITVCEYQLSAFFPKERREGIYSGAISRQMPFEIPSRLARACLLDKLASQEAQVEERRSGADGDRGLILSLQAIGLCDKHSAYNFTDAMPKKTGIKQTIEFRGHQGTFDSEEVTNWVLVLRSIVEFCHRTPSAEMHLFLLEMGQVPMEKCDTLKLLRTIETAPEAIEYYERVGLYPVDGPKEDPTKTEWRTIDRWVRESAF